MRKQEVSLFLKDVDEQRPLTPLASADKTFLTGVYKFGKAKHEGQLRASGEPYFEGHCVPVALKIASLGLDAESIAAGLLHDTIEDTETTHQEIKGLFGERTADLVEGVSKLGTLVCSI